ncbi:unnamed protein product [Owenia fusiformis]|uniref:non-specific serine/threonine protein kinase n=1 Tax=Owenia fusiformis TaxID=6347 RepID=A0A8J1TPZ9_OWEFU|nr:unnamed protein product [Owenia fusiformis]
MGRKIRYIGRYVMEARTLGKGNFARVELAIHNIAHCKVAIKIIDTRKIKEDYVKTNLHREARIMAQLRHPNIIRLFETLKATTLYCLVTEFAAGGELLAYIKTQKDARLTETQARPYVRQMLSALHYLHDRDVVHRDLKMENIMLDESKKNIKIIDFGLSNIYNKEYQLKTHCGSPEYAAPELFIQGKTYGPEVDIWSLGVIMYALVVGRLPFTTPYTDQYRRQKLLQQINKGLSQYHEKEMVYLTTDCKNILRQLIEPNAELRLPLLEIEIHAWTTKGGRSPFYPYQPPPRDKTIRSQVIEEMSKLLDMEREKVERTVHEYKSDEVSAMYNMMLDEKKRDLGYFEQDHTLRQHLRVAHGRHIMRQNTHDTDISENDDSSPRKVTLKEKFERVEENGFVKDTTSETRQIQDPVQSTSYDVCPNTSSSKLIPILRQPQKVSQVHQSLLGDTANDADRPMAALSIAAHLHPRPKSPSKIPAPLFQASIVDNIGAHGQNSTSIGELYKVPDKDIVNNNKHPPTAHHRCNSSSLARNNGFPEKSKTRVSPPCRPSTLRMEQIPNESQNRKAKRGLEPDKSKGAISKYAYIPPPVAPALSTTDSNNSSDWRTDFRYMAHSPVELAPKAVSETMSSIGYTPSPANDLDEPDHMFEFPKGDDPLQLVNASDDEKLQCLSKMGPGDYPCINDSMPFEFDIEEPEPYRPTNYCIDEESLERKISEIKLTDSKTYLINKMINKVDACDIPNASTERLLACSNDLQSDSTTYPSKNGTAWHSNLRSTKQSNGRIKGRSKLSSQLNKFVNPRAKCKKPSEREPACDQPVEEVNGPAMQAPLPATLASSHDSSSLIAASNGNNNMIKASAKAELAIEDTESNGSITDVTFRGKDAILDKTHAHDIDTTGDEDQQRKTTNSSGNGKTALIHPEEKTYIPSKDSNQKKTQAAHQLLLMERYDSQKRKTTWKEGITRFIRRACSPRARSPRPRQHGSTQRSTSNNKVLHRHNNGTANRGNRDEYTEVETKWPTCEETFPEQEATVTSDSVERQGSPPQALQMYDIGGGRYQHDGARVNKVKHRRALCVPRGCVHWPSCRECGHSPHSDQESIPDNNEDANQKMDRNIMAVIKMSGNVNNLQDSQRYTVYKMAKS